MNDPIAFTASSSPDILNFNQAMKAEDSKEFLQAMSEEIDAHTDNDHWELGNQDDIPDGHYRRSAVTAARRQRKVSTQPVHI